MAYSAPARSTIRPTRSTVCRRVLLGTALTFLSVATAAPAGAASSTSSAAKADTAYLSHVQWPTLGQAALALGGGSVASPDQEPVPIASLTKVMTAVLALKQYPLSVAEDGFTVTITPAQVQTEARDAADGGSVVAVQAGERLTERQLLEALLIPSGNNIAQVLAVRVAGNESRFLAEMNAEARSLRMHHTTYTDPSGFDSGTVSTAADQLRVLQQAMSYPVFRQIASTASVPFPVVGTLTNTNPLIADGYAGKTGSDTAAGACLAFFTNVTLDGSRLTADGVVLGQWQDNEVVLAAAGDAAEQLVDSIIPAASVPTVPASAGGLPLHHRSPPIIRRRP